MSRVAFYIAHHSGPQQLLGWEVSLPSVPHRRFFADNRKGGGGWSVTDGATGLLVGRGMTRAAAISDADRNLGKYSKHALDCRLARAARGLAPMPMPRPGRVDA